MSDQPTTEPYGADVREYFGINEEQLLGRGLETRVYFISDEEIVRIYAPGSIRRSIYAFKRFYDSLDGSGLSFALPRVYQVGEKGGSLYSVENRMPGRSLDIRMQYWDGEHRATAITNYLEATLEIQSVAYTADFYGEAVHAPFVRRPTWQQFLTDRAQLALDSHCEALRQAVPGLDQVVSRWHESLGVLDRPERRLVHGDVWPGNVLVDRAGKVTGITDFSSMTVVGDPFMDVATAVMFLELTPGFVAADGEQAWAWLYQRYGAECLPAYNAYARYNALMYAGSEDYDTDLYDWCIATLRSSEELPHTGPSRVDRALRRFRRSSQRTGAR